jgi:esterase/lipase superfamily enzyme
VDPKVEPYKSMLAREKILAIDLSGLKSDDPLGHGTFAQSPEVVRLIGTRLAGGQALGENRTGLGDTLGLAVSGAVDTVGSAATLAVSAPIAIVDPATRANLGDRVQDLSQKVTNTVTLRDVRDAVH